MQLESNDFLHFRCFRRLDGAVECAGFGRHNGKTVASFSANSTDPYPERKPEPYLQEQSRLFVNLNVLERQTWRKLLTAQSIASIAREEGVSRQAIYTRIEGNRFGQGGMIGKNFWVLLWWRLRQKQAGR